MILRLGIGKNTTEQFFLALNYSATLALDEEIEKCGIKFPVVPFPDVFEDEPGKVSKQTGGSGYAPIHGGIRGRKKKTKSLEANNSNATEETQ